MIFYILVYFVVGIVFYSASLIYAELKGKDRLLGREICFNYIFTAFFWPILVGLSIYIVYKVKHGPV